MLTKHNVFEVSRQGYVFLANTRDNNGRVMRRFLQHLTQDGLVCQTFSQYEDKMAGAQFQATVRFAKRMHEHNLQYLAPQAAAGCLGTVVDDMFGIVFNGYKLPHDVATASVRQLREMVSMVVVLSDNLHRWVSDSRAVMEALESGYFVHEFEVPPDALMVGSPFATSFGQDAIR